MISSRRAAEDPAGDGCTWLKPEDYDEVLGNTLDLLVLPV